MVDVSDEARADLLHRLRRSLRSCLRLADALDLGIVGIKVDGALIALADEMEHPMAYDEVPLADIPHPAFDHAIVGDGVGEQPLRG